MGRVIDANAMYQAGRGAGPQGVKEPIWGEYIEGLGKMVIDSTVKGFSKLNDFREKSQAQTALIDLKIDKISKDNPYLKNDILSWKVDYDKAAYCAIFGISAKKRSACREQRAFAMAKLTGANELLTTFQKNAGQAQGSMHLENGGTLPGNEEQKQEFDEKKNKGGMVKKKTSPMQMAMGGMANGKKHMYLSNGGSVKDNAGLRALRSSGPKGMEAYNKITGK